jgi:hypothetical protein
MTQFSGTAPTPDLRIVPVELLLPHEEHDSQRSLPLIERLRIADLFTNPPMVGPIEGDPDGRYVIMDGANRHYCFQRLGFPYILVQVVPYDSPWLELGVWNHVISDWHMATFMMQLRGLEAVIVSDSALRHPLARLAVPDGRTFYFHTPAEGIHARSAVLREIVRLYQRQASLNRTAQTEPEQVFPDYPLATGLMLFPHYGAHHIMEAALQRAFVPPGISRHIIYGRATRLNFPMHVLQDTTESLELKNERLQQWLYTRFANRQVRYYAESTYVFDE